MSWMDVIAPSRSAVLDRLKVAVLATDGFEQVEVTRPMAALERAGADVEVVSLHAGKIQGVHAMVPGSRLQVHRTVDEARPYEYDALLLPGGFISPDSLRQNARALQLVREIDAAGKPIAVICHGPWLLASAERVGGRRLTSWPGIRDDLEHAGARWEDAPVVQDGNWVSSRGPHDLDAFIPAMVSHFAASVPENERHGLERESHPLGWALAAAGLGALCYFGPRYARLGTWGRVDA